MIPSPAAAFLYHLTLYPNTRSSSTSRLLAELCICLSDVCVVDDLLFLNFPRVGAKVCLS